MSKQATYGHGKKTLSRNSDCSVLNKDYATNIVKIKIISIEWYVPHFTPLSHQKVILSEQILSKVPTKLQNVERSVFIKEVTIRNSWSFELETPERTNNPLWISIGFQQKDRKNSRNLNKDTFNRSPATSAQCIVGTEKCPNSAIYLKFDDDANSQRYGQIKEAFKALT